MKTGKKFCAARWFSPRTRIRLAALGTIVVVGVLVAGAGYVSVD